MNKKKIFISSLIIVAPFFVKGFSTGLKSKQKADKHTISIIDDETNYVFQGRVFPLKADNSTGRSSAVNMFNIKYCLYQELGYLSDIDFYITSFADNSVKYERKDGSGFVRKSGSRTWRNMNPGAIRTSPFTRKVGACGDAGGFAVFPNEEIGMIALKELLRTDAYTNLTIYDAIHKYAPFCDNNDPVRYQNHLYAKTGINVNRRLCDLSEEELDKIAQTIKVLEGWEEGICEPFGGIAAILHEFYNIQKQYKS